MKKQTSNHNNSLELCPKGRPSSGGATDEPSNELGTNNPTAEEYLKELDLWEKRNPYWENEELGQKALSELRVLFKEILKLKEQEVEDKLKKSKQNFDDLYNSCKEEKERQDKLYTERIEQAKQETEIEIAELKNEIKVLADCGEKLLGQLKQAKQEVKNELMPECEKCSDNFVNTIRRGRKKLKEQAKQETEARILGIIEDVFSKYKICANESPMAFAEWEVEKDVIIKELTKKIKDKKE